MTGTSFVLEFIPLRGDNEFEPHPQNKILVPFRGTFQNFQRLPPSLLYGSLPTPPPPPNWVNTGMIQMLKSPGPQ